MNEKLLRDALIEHLCSDQIEEPKWSAEVQNVSLLEHNEHNEIALASVILPIKESESTVAYYSSNRLERHESKNTSIQQSEEESDRGYSIHDKDQAFFYSLEFNVILNAPVFFTEHALSSNEAVFFNQLIPENESVSTGVNIFSNDRTLYDVSPELDVQLGANEVSSSNLENASEGTTSEQASHPLEEDQILVEGVEDEVLTDISEEPSESVSLPVLHPVIQFSASDDQFNLMEDGILQFSLTELLNNDLMIGSSGLHLVAFGTPHSGLITTLSSGFFTYTPDENFFGVDQFSYTVCNEQGLETSAQVMVYIEQVNDAPVVSDISFSIDEDEAIRVTAESLLSSVTDIDSTALMITDVTTNTTDGTLVNNQDDSWTFTPNQDFNGDVSFQFTVSDGEMTSVGTIVLNIEAMIDAVGDASNNRLYGGVYNDEVHGLGGHDRLYGREGSDSLDGGSGNDQLYGESGADALEGGAGNDRLYGGDGIDTLLGGEGNDSLYASAEDAVISGGAGTDRLYVQTEDGVSIDLSSAELEHAYGNAGNDHFDGSGVSERLVLRGYEGQDVLSGGDHNDRLYGGVDADTLFGDAGHDRLYGEAGEDALAGGTGNDRLYGGDGSDTLTGGLGTDWLDGGAGNDVLYVDAHDLASGRVSAGDGWDILHVESGVGDVMVDVASVKAEYITTEEGHDVVDASDSTWSGSIFTKDGDDTVMSGSQGYQVGLGSGDDVFYGASEAPGHDTVWSGAGDDYVFAGRGNDLLYGGAGEDTLYGSLGNDTLWGGSGNDTLDGGQGSDLLKGGSGDDLFIIGTMAANDHSTLIGGEGMDVLQMNLNAPWVIVVDGMEYVDASHPIPIEKNGAIYFENSSSTIDFAGIEQIEWV